MGQFYFGRVGQNSIGIDSKEDNQLAAQINAIEPGEQVSEILMTLASGETLCATLPNDEVKQLKLHDTVIASFNARHAIVATLL